jgi:hypothetical protein
MKTKREEDGKKERDLKLSEIQTFNSSSCIWGLNVILSIYGSRALCWTLAALSVS